MNIEVYPHTLTGNVEAIASKSQAHRLIIAAALSDKDTTVNINSLSEDIQATLNVLDALGATAQQVDDTKLIISPLTKAKANARLNCGESGSTLRFMLPVAAALGARDAVFTGEGKLPKRPMEPLLTALAQKGVVIKGTELPLRIKGQLEAGTFSLPGNISSQFISGLLFALPLLPEDSSIEITSPRESQGYIDMTIAALKIFGIQIQETDKGYYIKGGQKYISPGAVKVEGDWSNAAFWFTAGALGKTITVTGLDESSYQGDKAILPILEKMGAKVIRKDNAVTVSPSPLQGIQIDAGEIPDLVPILSVAAAGAQGKTVIKNAQRLRLKESDRLLAMNQCLSLLGGDIKETEDGLIINGGQKLDGTKVPSFQDHRIVMSMAIASVIAKSPIIIQGAESVKKSYPHFFRDFQRLGGLVNVIYLR